MDVALTNGGPASTSEPDSRPLQQQNERPKKSKRVSSSDTGVTKPKQTKSRNGCSTCKAKRLKCDESKPTCLQCTKRGVVCGGYKKEFKWRSANEDTFDFKTSSGPAPKQTPTKSSTTAQSPSSNPTRPRPAQDHQQAPALATSFSSTSPPLAVDSRLPQTIPAQSSGSRETVINPFDILHAPDPRPQTPAALYQGYQSILPSPPDQSTQYQEFPGQGYRHRMPSISDLLQQESHFNGQLPEIQSPLPSDGTLPPGWDMPPQQSTRSSTYPINVDEDEDVEEIVRNQSELQGDMPWSSDPSVFSDNDILTPNNMVAIRRSQTPIFARPQLDNTSWEMLFSAFDRNTCAIMSVRNGVGENPWRIIIEPLLKNSSALRFAVAAMSAFHSSFDIPSLRQQAVAYVSESAKALINEPNEKPEVVLASTLAMAFAESWDSGEASRTGLDYIKVARKLVPRVLNGTLFRPHSSVDMERIRFLCKTWIYIDVIARLTSIDEDVSVECEEVSLQLARPTDMETKVDPLMGSASTLFPILGRVANLVRRVCKVSVNSPDIIDTARGLKEMLERWNPPPPFAMPDGDQHELTNSLHTAEAYRWSTLLYLHQAVPEMESLDSQLLARQALSHLIQVPMDSQVVIVQIYPLFAAGCEVDDEETRSWVSNRWEAMAQRMRIGNTYRCGQVVKEVWRRRDQYRMASAQLQRANSMPEDYAEYAGLSRFGFDGTRRATFPNGGHNFTPDLSRSQSVDSSTLDFDPAYTVRGRLHWVSVMKDNSWEILLG